MPHSFWLLCVGLVWCLVTYSTGLFLFNILFQGWAEFLTELGWYPNDDFWWKTLRLSRDALPCLAKLTFLIVVPSIASGTIAAIGLTRFVGVGIG